MSSKSQSRTARALYALVFLAVTALSAAMPLAAARAEGAFDLGPGLSALPPVQHEGLAVFAIVRAEATGSSRDGRYLTLRAGLERKDVTVEEVGRGGSVNTLRVINNSKQPLLILGGELVLGGQQDRVMARDTIVGPMARMDVEVFCVEHGRWAGGRKFGSAGGLAEGGLRLRAKYGGSQSAVWDRVAKKNEALKAQNSTGTYRDLADGEQGRKVSEPYRKAISAGFAKSTEGKNVVGLVAAVGGRVVSVDLFDSPELFAQYRDQLLGSLYVSAADQPKSADPAKPPPPSEIRDFFTKARAAKSKATDRGAGKAVEHKNAEVVGVELMAPKDDKSPSAPAVYESYQSVAQ